MFTALSTRKWARVCESRARRLLNAAVFSFPISERIESAPISSFIASYPRRSVNAARLIAGNRTTDRVFMKAPTRAARSHCGMFDITFSIQPWIPYMSKKLNTPVAEAHASRLRQFPPRGP